MSSRVLATAVFVISALGAVVPAQAAVTVSTNQADFVSIRNVDVSTFPFGPLTLTPVTSYTLNGVTFTSSAGSTLTEVGAPLCDLGGTTCLNSSATGAPFTITWGGPVLGLILRSRSIFNQSLSYTLNGSTSGTIPIGNLTSSPRFIGFDTGSTTPITLTLDPSQPFGIAITQFLTAVPEPSTWALMVFGFGAAGTMLRRKLRVRRSIVYV